MPKSAVGSDFALAKHHRFAQIFPDMALSSLTIETAKTRSLSVRPEDGIVLDAEAGLTVLSTPAMIMQMELTAKELLAEYHEADTTSVGATVNITHLAPTPVGAEVTYRAKLQAVEKSSYRFEVEASDVHGIIGKGEHTRAVLPIAKLKGALAKRHPAVVASEAKASAPKEAFQVLQLSSVEEVLTVTLNRPAKLNAINEAMTVDLERLLDEMESGQCSPRALLLKGAGRGFCAGEDIKENAAKTPEESIRLAARRSDICWRLSHLGLPSLAVVHGACMGGGVALALACDTIMATPDSRFAMPEVKLGWPAPYALDLLTARVGRARALALALSGETISAHDAHVMGLVDAIVPESMLEQKIAGHLRKFQGIPLSAIAETKRLINGYSQPNPRGFLEAGLKAYGVARSSESAINGMRQFLK